MCEASPSFMIAPLPNRRSICCNARSIALSRSDVATGPAELLRSETGFSFLFIRFTVYRVCGTDRLWLLPSRSSPPLHSSFFMTRNKKQAHSQLLHFFSFLVDTHSYSSPGSKKLK